MFVSLARLPTATNMQLKDKHKEGNTQRHCQHSSCRAEVLSAKAGSRGGDGAVRQKECLVLGCEPIDKHGQD